MIRTRCVKAIPRQDAVIHCLAMDHTATTATRIIVDAMVRRDVRRLVVATTTGDSLDETMTSSIKRVRLPVFAPRIGDPSLVGRDGSEERVIRDSPLDWDHRSCPNYQRSRTRHRTQQRGCRNLPGRAVERSHQHSQENRCEKLSIPVGYRRGVTLSRHCSKRTSRKGQI